MIFDTKLAERLDVPMLREAIDLLNQILAVREAKKDTALASQAQFTTANEGALAELARCRLKQQRSRQRYLPQAILRDPAWNILLDLLVHDLQGVQVSVTDACGASGVAPTTALRWITQLETLGLIERCRDAADARRSFVFLTETARHDILRWLQEER